MKVRLLSDTLAPACARGCTWCSVAGRLAGCHLFRPARRGQSRRRHGSQRGGRGCVTGGTAAAVLQRSAVRRRLAHGAQRRDRRHRDYKQPWCAAGRGHATRQKDGKSQKAKGPDFGAVRPGTPFREWFSGLWQRRSVTMPNVPDWPASQPERSSLDLATRPCRAPKAIGCFEQLEQFEQLDASPASRAAGLGTRSRAASDEIR